MARDSLISSSSSSGSSSSSSSSCHKNKYIIRENIVYGKGFPHQ
jgi:hypothetical protein